MQIINKKFIAILILLMVPSFGFALSCVPDADCSDVEWGGNRKSDNKDDVIIGIVAVAALSMWYFYEPEESAEAKALQLTQQKEEKDYLFSVVPILNDRNTGVSFSFGYKY